MSRLKPVHQTNFISPLHIPSRMRLLHSAWHLFPLNLRLPSQRSLEAQVCDSRPSNSVDVEVQEEVSLQVEAASGEEDSNKVTESAMPISKGCSSIYATRMQEQNPEVRKWNQIHSAWSDYVHSEEMQYQYEAVIISVADILPCKNAKIKKDKVLQNIAWTGDSDKCSGTVLGTALELQIYRKGRTMYFHSVPCLSLMRKLQWHCFRQE
jgi:hypothetical protein